MTTSNPGEPAGVLASPAAALAAWGLLRHPLLWRESIPDTAVVAVLLYTVAALLPATVPNQATELWTLGQIEIARKSASVMLFMVAALLLMRQLNCPLGDQPLRVHAAVWAMNVGIASVLLGAGVVYKLMLDRHLSQALPAAQVQRMNELHGYYGYWTCLGSMDKEALRMHGETLKQDLDVFGLRTDLTVASGAELGPATRVCSDKQWLVVMTRASAKARPDYGSVDGRGAIGGVDVGNLLFRGRLEGLAQTHQRLSFSGAELAASLLGVLVQAGLIAFLVGAAGMHPTQRNRLHLLRHWPAWCRVPDEGTLARLSGLGRFERWLLMRAPWVWTLAPHRIMLSLAAAAAVSRLPPVETQRDITVLALTFVVGLASIVRQSRYKLQATSLLLWPAYAVMMLLVCVPAIYLGPFGELSASDANLMLLLAIYFVCLPFTVAAVLAQALDPIRAAAAWIAGMVGSLSGIFFVEISTFFFGWAAVASLVCAAVMLGQSRRLWVRWMAVAVVASSSGAALTGVDGVQVLNIDWTENGRAAVTLLIVMIAAAASVLVLNRKRSQPCNE